MFQVAEIRGHLSLLLWRHHLRMQPQRPHSIHMFTDWQVRTDCRCQFSLHLTLDLVSP